MTQQDPLENIKTLLENKSNAKQITYKNLLSAFKQLQQESKRVVSELAKKIHPDDTDVTVSFEEVNEHEFHVKLAGDLLVFVLHTNIVTFEETHAVMKDPYVMERDINRYFGQIMIYNFMSDSVKFNRINDPGYLVARLLINHEGRFLIEGEGQLSFLYNKVSQVSITATDLNIVMKLALTIAIENDLMAPPYPQVQFITLNQKLEKTQELGAGSKIGFRMSYQSKVE